MNLTDLDTFHGFRASDFNTLREAIATAIGISAKDGAPFVVHVEDFDYIDAFKALACWCSEVREESSIWEFLGTDLTSGRPAHVVLVEVRS